MQQTRYQGARQVRFVLFPGSALFRKQPAAVMSAETRRDQQAVRADERRIDPAGANPCRRSREAHLRRAALGEEAGIAIAIERVTLYASHRGKTAGAVARIDAAWARDLFIRSGWWTASGISIESTHACPVRPGQSALRAELAGLEERTAGATSSTTTRRSSTSTTRESPPTSRRLAGSRLWRDEHKNRPDLLTMTRETLARRDDNR